ncbi:hypothetical protein [Vibrio owensii]|uniref:hypothetical protein n=1 Tax=Vibrio owensii TaxID=696485 RepID=UPI003CC61DAA
MSYRHSLHIGDDGALCASVCGKSYIALFQNILETEDLKHYTYPVVCAYLFDKIAKFDVDRTFNLWQEKLQTQLDEMSDEYTEPFLKSLKFHVGVITREMLVCPIESPTDYFEKWLNPVIMDLGHEKYDLKDFHEFIMNFMTECCIDISLPEEEFEFAENVLKPLCAEGLFQKVSML